MSINLPLNTFPWSPHNNNCVFLWKPYIHESVLKAAITNIKVNSKVTSLLSLMLGGGKLLI